MEESGQLGDGRGPVPVGHGDGRAVSQQGLLQLLHVQTMPVRERWGSVHTAGDRMAVELTQSRVAVEPAKHNGKTVRLMDKGRESGGKNWGGGQTEKEGG